MGYLNAVDSLDVEAVLGFLAEDPLLVVEPAGAVLRGRHEVRGTLAQLLGASAAMKHEVLALIVDVETARVAIELNYHDTPRAGGPTTVLHDSTHLQFDSTGKIQKIQFWLGHDLA
jgi:ketosteroid isomerase-like protein